MKRLFIFLVGMTVCFMIIFFVSLGEKTNTANLPEVSTPNPLYIVKDNDGIITIYRYDENEPYETTDIRIDSLPEYDRESLKKGIFVYSDEQLGRLMEDFD